MSQRFYFRPHRFEHAVKEAVSVHRQIHTPTLGELRTWIADFLEELARTPESDYPELAARLRFAQLGVLAQHLGSLHRDPVFRKLATLLLIRPDRTVCRTLWGLVGRFCDESGVMAVVQRLRRDPAWTGLSPPDLPPLPDRVVDGAGLGRYLADLYVRYSTQWINGVTAWRSFSPSTAPDRWEDLPLGRRCLRELLTGTRTPIVLRESAVDLRRWASELLRDLDDFRRFAHNYLEQVAPTGWSDELVHEIVKRLGDPRLAPDRWVGFSPAVIQSVIRWINTRKLAEFFLVAAGDRRRFEFWKQFVDELGPNSEGRVQAGQGFFEFPGFGVIEFMEVGNAAYIYPLDAFERFRREGVVPNSFLKDRSLSIDRIIHSPPDYWPTRWTPVIRGLIDRGKRGR